MSTPGRIAFVTGATGAVGPALVRALLADGYRVRALVRPGRSDGLPEAAERIAGDLDDGPALQRGVDGASAVFHLAALLHVNAPGPALHERYEAVNVDGTRRLLDAAGRSGRPRVVFFSTINVYGPSRPGHAWTEADAPAPGTVYADTKARAENLVRGYGDGVVLRVSAVYGPGMKGNYVLLGNLLRRGVRWMVGHGRNRRTLVHVEDLARAALLAAEHPDAAGETFNVTDGDVHTFDAIVRAMQRAYGRPEGLRYVPAAPVRALLALTALARHIGVRRAPSPVLVDKLTEEVAVSGARLQERLGFRPRFGLDAGWRDALGTGGAAHPGAPAAQPPTP